MARVRKRAPSDSRLRRWAVVGAILFLHPTFADAQSKQDDAEIKEPLRPARENQLLRSHFREQYLSMHRPLDPSFPPNESFLESFVNKRIDHFVEKTEERMIRSREALESVLGTSREIAELPSTRPDRVLSKRWKGELKTLSKEIGALHRSLSTVFVDLKSKCRFHPQIDRSPENRGFHSELVFVGSELDGAFRRIRDYLIEPSNVVRLGDLQDDNMLYQLNRAQRTVNHLRKNGLR